MTWNSIQIIATKNHWAKFRQPIDHMSINIDADTKYDINPCPITNQQPIKATILKTLNQHLWLFDPNTPIKFKPQKLDNLTFEPWNLEVLATLTRIKEQYYTISPQQLRWS